MKLKFTLLYFLFLYSIEILAHGGHMATFKYQMDGNQISLEFKIEKSIFEHFDLKNKCENFQTATALCLTNYINANTGFKINDEKIAFELQGAKKDHDFFVIEMIAAGKFAEYDHLTISNQCFIEFDRKFENRIIILKNNEIKSYRLNRKNTELNIKN